MKVDIESDYAKVIIENVEYYDDKDRVGEVHVCVSDEGIIVDLVDPVSGEVVSTNCYYIEDILTRLGVS